MKSKKKIVHFLWGFPVLILCLAMGSAVAYAALMIKDEKVNIFQIGNLQTKVKEVFTEPITIKPNEAVIKEVAVENTGTINQFVRVMLHPEIRIENSRVLPSKIGEEILLDLNSLDWKLGEDGYYYYLKVLHYGESNVTENLFTEVKLRNELSLEYQQANFSLLVKVEAISCVQYAYRDAWWKGSIPSSGELRKIDEQLAEKTD